MSLRICIRPPSPATPSMHRLVGGLLLALASIGHADTRASAIETFKSLHEALASDKKKADWHAFLADARRLKAFLNDSPTSGLEVARAQLELGQPESALLETRRFLAMGQTNAILSTPLFEPLRRTIDAQLKTNMSPASLAAHSFQISDAASLPEDIDYDAQSKRFFISSVVRQRVLTRDRGSLDGAGPEQTFADAPDHWPILALKVDAKRRRLWATEVAVEGFTVVPAADWGRSAVLEYDLDRGTLLARHEGPRHSGLSDMVLTENGEPIISDSTGGGIYRLHGNELVRIDHGDFISPQTIAICDGGRQAFVPDYVRGIAAFALETGSVRWLSTGDRYALDGIDGLYCHDHSLIAIQNGAAPERVVAFFLDASRSTIVGEKVIERATATLGDPTHGVFAAGSFFYIANSGWNGIDEHGVEKAGANPDKPRIMQVDAAAVTAKRIDR